MRKLGVAIALALMLCVAGCGNTSSENANPGEGSWVLGTWEGTVIDVPLTIEFTVAGDYEWIDAATGESLATGTWTATSDTSPVELRQVTGQEFVFSVAPYAVFDGETLHITVEEDYIIRVLIDPEAQPGNIEALMAELRRQSNVASADFVNAQDAAAELEAAADETETSVSITDTPARIEIALDDWSSQTEFIEWLGADSNFKIVRSGPDSIREPNGLEFTRVP